MAEEQNENAIPNRKKSIWIAIVVCLCSVLILFLLNFVKHKPQKFLLPLESHVQINYDPLRSIIDRNPKNKQKIVEENIHEAELNLKAYQELKRAGKKNLALKVLKHSLALSPNHPEILTEYGIFLETYNNDIIQADSFYFRALTYDPNHQRALTERQRSAPVVQNIDEERLRRLDAKRDLLAEVDSNSAAMKRATKEAYILHIYHSVGIEGNSMTLSETRSVLETKMAVSGRSVDEHNEIIGLDSAMKYVNASLVKNNYISLEDILEIHKRVLGHVDPIEGGVFRRTQVYVGNHIPPKPHEVHLLMNTFLTWMNSKEAAELHPIKLAAIAHYKLVHIHPFTDGNGRTSRLLMNTILMKFGFPPVVIQKQQRLHYYNYLQMANEGDIRPFIRFVAEATEKTLDLYLWATSELPYQVPLLAQAESIEARSPIILTSGLDDDQSGSGAEADADGSDAIRL